MSVSRYRGSVTIRHNSTTPTKRLEGLFAVAEDWHAEVVLLKVDIVDKYVDLSLIILELTYM